MCFDFNFLRRSRGAWACRSRGAGAGGVAALLFLAALLVPHPALADGEHPSRGREEARDSGREQGPEDPPLRFTDEDLKKYHRPRPGEEEGQEQEEDGEGDEADARASDGRTSPDAARADGGGKKPQPAPPRHGTRPGKAIPLGKARTPEQMGRVIKPEPAAAAPPPEDPLKPFREREAREAFRTNQIRTLREEISGMRSRLDYLRQRRLAILDPLRIMPEPQNDEDRRHDSGGNAQQMLESVEGEIESLEARIEQSEEKLVAIQTRFGAEAQGR